MKKFLALALATAMSLSLVACSSSSTSSTATESTTTASTTTTTTTTTEAAEEVADLEPVNFVYSSALPPTDPFAVGEQYFCERVAELSDGLITIDYYGNSSLYTQSEGDAAAYAGKIDFATNTFQDWDAAPEYAVFKAAYLFDDKDHAEAVYNSDLGQGMYDDIAEKVGIRPLGFAFYSTRQLNLYNVNKEINGPEDMSDVLIRMPSGAAWQSLGEAIGASVVGINLSEAYMAIKTGVANGQDNGLAVSVANSFDEVTDTVIMTEHCIYYMHIFVYEELWQTLTEQQQAWIQQAADEAHALISEKAEADEDALVQTYIDNGIEIIYPEDKQIWIDYAENFYRSEYAEQYTSSWDWDMYDAIRAMA